MDKLREAMETAIKAHWDEPVPSAPAAAVAGLRPLPAAPKTAPARPLARPREKQPARVAPLERDAWRARQVRVPDEMLARNRLVAALPASPEREAYCLLQAAVSERLAGGRVIGVSGPRGGRGKTLTAVNLAISLAVDARRDVVLIDLDLRAPRIHALFGVEPAAGVQDCLFNGAALSDALFSPSIDRFAVLPARGGSRSVSQILRSPNLRSLIESTESGHPDCITVIDWPPIANRNDAAALEALVDAMLLVVEDGVTREADYRRALQSVSKSKIIGTVLNRAEPS